MSALHYVTFKKRAHELTFECRGDLTSPCHQYPDDVEAWHEPDETFVPHERCWLQDWFDNDSATYTGTVREEYGDNDYPPVSASGPIVATFHSDHVEWDWARSREPHEHGPRVNPPWGDQ
jgi:hypothetical protein